MRRICFRLNVGSRSDLLLELSEKLRAHAQQRVQNRKYARRERPIDDGPQDASRLLKLTQSLEFRYHVCDGFSYVRKSGRYRLGVRWSGRHQAKKGVTNLVPGFVKRSHRRRQLLGFHNYVSVIELFFVFGEIGSQAVAQLQYQTVAIVDFLTNLGRNRR